MNRIVCSLAVLVGFSVLSICNAEDIARPAPGTGDAGVPLYQFSQCLEQLSRSPKEIVDNGKAIRAMTKELIKDDTIRGFGSMGGEEFFSYLNTSDSLHRIAAMTAALDPKSAPREWNREPLGEHVENGLKWLVSVQGKDGGWGQDGGEAENVRNGERLESKGNDIANTAVSTLALLRAGHSPTRGAYKENVQRAVNFIVAHVEQSKDDGLALDTPQGTQIQRKLGQFIDTFMASMLLAEVDGTLGDEQTNTRVRKALNKVIAKIEKNQNRDGTWNAAGGWAPILGTSYCSRSLDVAQRKGVAVDANIQANVNNWTVNNASISLAGTSAAAAKPPIAAAQQAVMRPAAQVAAANAAAAETPAEPLVIPAGIAVAAAKSAEPAAVPAVVEKPAPIAEKPADVDPIAAWDKWNAKIKAHVEKLQNQDGTWAGQHCITGRVACTGAAVLTLLAERAPIDVKAAK